MGVQEAKTIADFLIADFQSEMQTTQRVIVAVPSDHLDYRPEAKAKTGLARIIHQRSRSRRNTNASPWYKGRADGPFPRRRRVV